MPRIARIVLENIPYHVTQRGNGRQQVFYDRQDYQLYLDLLRAYAEVAQLQMWAYCLMPNHVHLIAVPQRPNSMASVLRRTHADFARHFNLRSRTCGHVWQARFFSCPLDAAHLWRAAAYIERNPVRARMVEHAWQHAWSSASTHVGLTANPGFLDLSAWQAEYTQPLERGAGNWSGGGSLWTPLAGGEPPRPSAGRQRVCKRIGKADWSRTAPSAGGADPESSRQETTASFRWRFGFECTDPSYLGLHSWLWSGAKRQGDP